MSVGSYLIQGIFPCLLSSVMLIFFVYFDNSLTRKTQRLFMAATIFVLGLTVSEGIDYYFQQTLTHHEIRTWLAAFSYTCRIGCIGFTAAITQRTKSVHAIFIHLGVVINAIVAFISIPTGCIFSINAAHQWSRGVLYYEPYAFVAWYSILLLVSSFQNFRSNTKEAFMILAGSLLCALGNIIELFLHWKLILSAAFLVYISFYFLCLNVQLYRHDAMTALLNRRSFFMDAKRYSGRNFVVVSMDLNDLKLFNDIEGHAAGDRALCAVGECMKAAFKKDGFGYRIGGDEFMAIILKKDVESAEAVLNNFKQKIARTKYKVACGCALHKPGDVIEDVMEVADKLMYENKRQIKGKNGVIR